MERRRFLTLTAGGFLAASFAAEAQQADKVHPATWTAGTSGSSTSHRRGGTRGSRRWRPTWSASRSAAAWPPRRRASPVRLKVDVIGAPAAQNVVAAKQATGTIPIVMVSVGDPVGNGLV